MEDSCYLHYLQLSSCSHQSVSIISSRSITLTLSLTVYDWLLSLTFIFVMEFYNISYNLDISSVAYYVHNAASCL
jgi:hypothetical protein